MIYLQSLMVPTSRHNGLQQRIPKAELTGNRVILGRFGLHSDVSYSKTLEDGTTIYRFSKDLLAYLKTLVAFSQYYYADDPRSAGNIDKYYKSALLRGHRI